MQRRAFTLVELLVVIAIIGLLSTVAVVAMNASGKNARNAKRKADLLQISKALALYYEDHGAYPATGSWQGDCSAYGGFPDVDPPDYPANASWIPGLTAGGYMARLPRDPRSGIVNRDTTDGWCPTAPNNSCYLYISNGVHYALIAHCTPEGTWTSSDPFYSDNAARAREWRVVSELNSTTVDWY